MAAAKRQFRTDACGAALLAADRHGIPGHFVGLQWRASIGYGEHGSSGHLLLRPHPGHRFDCFSHQAYRGRRRAALEEQWRGPDPIDYASSRAARGQLHPLTPALFPYALFRAHPIVFKWMQWRSDHSQAAYTAGGILTSGALTIVLYRLHLNFATAGFLQLLIVLMVAMRGGFWAATRVSLTAFFCLDFFFVPPLFRISVDDPQNSLALFAFEAAAILVSRLSTRSSQQSRHAVRSLRELECLYQLSRKLQLLPSEPSVMTQIALAIKDSFSARAVVVYDSRENVASAVGTGDPLLESEVRGACLLREHLRSSSPDTIIRMLSLESHAIGSLGIRGSLSSASADSLAGLVAVALEQTGKAKARARISQPIMAATVVKAPPLCRTERKSSSALD